MVNSARLAIPDDRGLFVAWKPPTGMELEAHYHLVQGGGFIVVDTESASLAVVPEMESRRRASVDPQFRRFADQCTGSRADRRGDHQRHHANHEARSRAQHGAFADDRVTGAAIVVIYRQHFVGDDDSFELAAVHSLGQSLEFMLCVSIALVTDHENT